LSELSVSWIKRGDIVMLNAGYEGNVKLLFRGDIRNIIPERSKADKIYTIYAGDGERSIKKSYFSKAFEKGTPIKEIILDVVASFKDTFTGDIKGINNFNNKLLGTSYSGASKDVLDKLALDYGFSWSIQNNKITIFRDDPANAENPVIILSRNSGMIGSPSVTEVGVDVIAQLNPALEVNNLIKVESDFPSIQLASVYFRKIDRLLGDGIFRINKVVHSGDNRSLAWTSSITGFRLL